MLRGAGVDAVRLSTAEPYAQALLRFFRQRGQRR